MDAAPGGARTLERSRWFGLRSLRVARPRVGFVVYAGTVVWTVVFAAAAMLEQHFFLLRRYDLGNFTQAVWSTAHGRFLQVTEVGGAEVSRLGIHVDPIIVGLVPLWWIWSSPDLLLAAHVVALALGAFPLYWLGRKHLPSSRDAAFVMGAYLICPVVMWNALGEFDAVAFAVPLLLLCIWFLDEDRLWAFAGAALLAVLCQEQIGLIVACLGAVYGFRTRRWRVAALVAVLGFGVTMVDLHVVLPHFSDGSPYSARFSGVGGSAGGVLHTSVDYPLQVAARILSPLHLFGLALLVVPVLALCFRSALMLAATLSWPSFSSRLGLATSPRLPRTSCRSCRSSLPVRSTHWLVRVGRHGCGPNTFS